MWDEEKRYKYLVKARNHHFSQFNVWMAFFITINGGIFVAYCKLLEKGGYIFEQLVVLFLGYVAAFLFYCSAKGYRYWITNYIKLIIDHEKWYFRDSKKNGIDDGRDRSKVYACFANKEKNFDYYSSLKGANISTGKIVSLLAVIMTYCWVALGLSWLYRGLREEQAKQVITKLLESLSPCVSFLHRFLNVLPPSALLLLQIVLLLGCVIFICLINRIFMNFVVERYLSSDLKDHTDLKIGEWK